MDRTSEQSTALTRLTFGAFRVDLRARTLDCEGVPVAITAKVFDALAILLQNHGKVVEKEAMMQALWPDTAVEEGNLHHYVSTLRKLLGEKSGERKYIVTVPGRGYSFVAPVELDETCQTAANPDPAHELLVPA